MTAPRKRITLTFDNGPTEDITPAVLATLRRFGVRSTFFVLGQNITSEAARKLIEQAADEGHWVGNHTYTHSVPLGQLEGDDVPYLEIGRTQELIGAISHPSKFFRPFGGDGSLGRHLLSPQAFEFLRQARYTCVLWNSVPRDWENPDGWVEIALAQARALEWALIVLHDYDTGAMCHLESFLSTALEEGFEFAQEFPPDCVPMERGIVKHPMNAFIALPTDGLQEKAP